MKSKNKEGQTFHEYLAFYFTDVLTKKIKRYRYLRRIVKRKWKHRKIPYFGYDTTERHIS